MSGDPGRLERTPEPVVRVRAVTKLFKTFKAVDDVSFEVYSGEIVGIVAPPRPSPRRSKMSPGEAVVR